jgi:hypothetical protein
MALLPSTGESREPSQIGQLRKRFGSMDSSDDEEVPATETMFAFKICTFFLIIDKGKYERMYLYVYKTQ